MLQSTKVNFEPERESPSKPLKRPPERDRSSIRLSPVGPQSGRVHCALHPPSSGGPGRGAPISSTVELCVRATARCIAARTA